MIEIDGSYGEGGGQILRTAVALSVVTQTPVRIINIRKGRPNPGIRAQHLAGVISVSKLCDGKLRGAEVGSTTLEFHPSEICRSKVDVDISTAGSVGLVLQTIQLACVGAGRKIEVSIRGGATYGKWAPPLCYVQNVTHPILMRMGYECRVDVIRDGFYPTGGAEVRVELNPGKLNPLRLTDRGEVLEIRGSSIASESLRDRNVAERQARSAKKLVENAEIDVEYVRSECPGSGITLWAITKNSVLGASALGEAGKRAEKVGEEAASSLLSELRSNAALDRYMGDQVIPYIGLAGNSEVTTSEITMHCRTNIYVVERILGCKFIVERDGRVAVR